MVQFTTRTVVVAQVEEHWSTELSANTRKGAEHLSNLFHTKRSNLDAAEKVEQISSQISHRPRPPFWSHKERMLVSTTEIVVFS